VHCDQIPDHYLLYRTGVLKMKSSHALTSHKGHTVCDYSSGNHVWCDAQCESCRPTIMHDVWLTAATRAIARSAFTIPFSHIYCWVLAPSFACMNLRIAARCQTLCRSRYGKMLFAQHAHATIQHPWLWQMDGGRRESWQQFCKYKVLWARCVIS
jgi:hypothetical protein